MFTGWRVIIFIEKSSPNFDFRGIAVAVDKAPLHLFRAHSLGEINRVNEIPVQVDVKRLHFVRVSRFGAGHSVVAALPSPTLDATHHSDFLSLVDFFFRKNRQAKIDLDRFNKSLLVFEWTFFIVSMRMGVKRSINLTPIQ
jgi:hypothetical protein